MHRFKGAGLLAAMAVCCGATTLRGQVNQAPYFPDAAYSTEVAPAPTANHLVSSGAFHADDAGLADRVSDLEAELKSIKDKEAAAKKKAAGKPSVAVGGRLFADWTMYNQDANSVT